MLDALRHTGARRLDEEDSPQHQEDEEEELVREVLRDFPPEEKGERPEWNERVGWHRKENIRKGRNHQGQDEVERQKSPLFHQKQNFALDESQQSSTLSHPTVTLLASLLLLVGFLLFRILRKRDKHRTL